MNLTLSFFSFFLVYSTLHVDQWMIVEKASNSVRRSNVDIDACARQSQEMGDQLGLENAADEWVTFLRWSKIDRLIVRSSEALTGRGNLLTSQSSRRVDIEMVLIALSAILRSRVYIV